MYFLVSLNKQKNCTHIFLPKTQKRGRAKTDHYPFFSTPAPQKSFPGNDEASNELFFLFCAFDRREGKGKIDREKKL